ncbi:MAG: hypothetical protein U0R51_06945 [Solirubrobacterales bacterium]
MARGALTAAIATAAIAIAPGAAGAAPSYPPDGPLVTVPTPKGVERPGYLDPITDPSLGTTITRISDRRTFDQPRATSIRHAYAKNQPWNADGSLLMLDYHYPAPLLDGETLELVGEVHQPSEAIWMNTDPGHMIGMSGRTKLIAWDAVADHRSAVLHRFRGYDRVELGNGEGNLSNDDRFAALLGTRGSALDVLVYDTVAGEVVAKRRFEQATSGDGDATINNVAMSQSGERVLVEFNRRGRGGRRGIVSYDRSLGDPVPLSANGGSHYDSCVEAGGNEVVVAQADGSSALVSADLEDGTRTRLLPADRMGYPIHISCRNVERPGWVYVSEFADRGAPRLANRDSLLAVSLDGSGTVERFGHEFRSNRSAYVREPHAVPSRDGSRVLWASDWQCPHGPVYAYVAEAGG